MVSRCCSRCDAKSSFASVFRVRMHAMLHSRHLANICLYYSITDGETGERWNDERMQKTFLSIESNCNSCQVHLAVFETLLFVFNFHLDVRDNIIGVTRASNENRRIYCPRNLWTTPKRPFLMEISAAHITVPAFDIQIAQNQVESLNEMKKMRNEKKTINMNEFPFNHE